MHVQHEHELSSSLFLSGRNQTSYSIIKASNCSYFATIYPGVCLRQASVFFNPSQHQISSFAVFFFHTVTPIYWEEGTGTHLTDRQLLWLPRYHFLFSKSLALSTNKPPFIRLLYTGNFFCNFFFQFNQRYKLLAIQIESPNCNTSRCNSRVTAIKFPRKRKPCYFNLHSGQTFHRKGHFPSENINLIFR